MIYRESYPIPAEPGRDGAPTIREKPTIKSESMGSMMIIFLIAHLFKKDQTYASLFSSALKEGIRDAFGQASKKSGGVVSNKISAFDK